MRTFYIFVFPKEHKIICQIKHFYHEALLKNKLIRFKIELLIQYHKSGGLLHIPSLQLEMVEVTVSVIIALLLYDFPSLTSSCTILVAMGYEWYSNEKSSIKIERAHADSWKLDDRTKNNRINVFKTHYIFILVTL